MMTKVDDIQKLTQEAAALLKDMVAVPSPSFHEAEVCSLICRWLSQKGIGHERIGNNIVAESIIDSSRPTFMLCAHIDTVEASLDYSFDPYRPDYPVAAKVVSNLAAIECNENDIVAGLGSNDDGASAVAMIAVYRHFIKKAAEDSGPNVVLVLTCEEERSGKGGMTGLWGKRLCRRDERITGCTPIDYAIVGEPTGMRAAIAERGLLVIDARAYGVSGHAARNEGKNALYIALEDIDRLRHHTFEKVSPIMGKVNINVTQIYAGSAHNVIPDQCDFVIDIRPTEQYTNEEILRELQYICKSDLIPRNLSNLSSATEPDSPLIEAAEDLGIDTFSSPTTSDWMRITCDAVKMGPGESSRSHRKDEYVLIEEIHKGIKTYIKYINHIIK